MDYISRLSPQLQRLYKYIFALCDLCIAEAILTFLISLPMISIQILCLLDRLLVEDMKSLVSEEELEKGGNGSRKVGNSNDVPS